MLKAPNLSFVIRPQKVFEGPEIVRTSLWTCVSLVRGYETQQFPLVESEFFV